MAVHWILKNTTEYRIDTIEEVEEFHQQLQDQAAEGGYTLTSFSWIKKEVTKQGEIIDEYFVTKAVFTINNPKEPELPCMSISINKIELD